MRVSVLFFYRLPTRPTWNNNALSAQPQKKKIQKILVSGSPTTEFYFPQKGGSVSNSYFYSSRVFIRIRIWFMYLIYIRVLFRAIHSAQQKNSPFGQFHHYFFFLFLMYIFPIHFIKIRCRAKHKGGERGLYRNNKGPHKTKPSMGPNHVNPNPEGLYTT